MPLYKSKTKQNNKRKALKQKSTMSWKNAIADQLIFPRYEYKYWTGKAKEDEKNTCSSTIYINP